MEINKCNQSVIIDTNLNCWSDSNDASSILPVDDLSKKTPHDSIFLNMIHIMTKLMDRVRSKSACFENKHTKFDKPAFARVLHGESETYV